MKPKKFVSVYICNPTNTIGEEHTLVVVGLWEKKIKWRTKTATHGNGTLTWKERYTEFSLTLGKAICHPNDKFDEETGVQLALKRIKKGDNIGKLTTEDYTMLTPDNCQMIVEHKGRYIASNIEHYLPKAKI